MGLDGWTAERIEAACAETYAAYAGEVRRRHIEYFERHPELRSATHLWLARTRRDAFPEGWQQLAGVLPEGSWHRHHLSGTSSQVLAIALLAATAGTERLGLFEVELAPAVLGEQPRQTALDFLAIGPDAVSACEAKFTEQGFGRCSCNGRDRGECSDRVLARPYWRVAERALGLARGGADCGLGLAYQAVRNIAAAEAIAGPRRASSFVLLYDERNPYFGGAGDWPGWVEILRGLMAGAATTFEPRSWQELLLAGTVDPGVRDWALEKHGLG